MMMNLILTMLIGLALVGIAASRKNAQPVRVRVRVRPEDRYSRK